MTKSCTSCGSPISGRFCGICGADSEQQNFTTPAQHMTAWNRKAGRTSYIMGNVVLVALGIIVLFVVVVIFAAIFAGNPKPSRPIKPAATTATVGDMTYTITNFGVRPRFGRGVAVGEYLILGMVVRNISNSTATVTNSDFSLKGSNGNNYAPVDYRYVGEFSHRRVSVGKSVSGTLVFDVPADTAPTDYTIDLWGNDDDVSRHIALP